MQTREYAGRGNLRRFWTINTTKERGHMETIIKAIFEKKHVTTEE